MGREERGDDPLSVLLQRGYRYALALTHDRAQAEDLLHDAFAGVLARGKAESMPYLIRAIRNRWIDSHRRQKIVPMVARSEGEREADQDSALQSLLLHDEIGRALAALTPDEREALYLHAVCGWTAAEIGLLTERPRNTILTVLARARAGIASWRSTERRKEVL